MALQCEDIIRRGLGRNMTDDEIKSMEREALDLAAKMRAARQAAGQTPNLQRMSANYANRKALAAIGQERARQLQLAKRHAAYQYCVETFAGQEWEGLQAMLVSGKLTRKGARVSVDSIRTSLSGMYCASLVNDLERLGPNTLKLLRDETMQRHVASALWSLDRPAPTPAQPQPQYTGPAEGLEIAKVINKWQERARMDANDAGAWIGKMPGYICRQSHDQLKIARAGYDKWKADTEPLLDWTRVHDGAYENDLGAREKFLTETYSSLSTGVHEKYDPAGLAPPGDPLAKPRTVGSRAAKMSHERTIHFTDGDAWFNYNQLYGKGGMLEAIVGGLQKSANDTALMRVFGPSPQENLEGVIRDLRMTFKERGDTESVKKLAAAKKKLDNSMKELDGSLNIEGNPTLAQIGGMVRSVQSMAKLGGALISGFSDIPLMAMEMKYQGIPFFKALGEGLRLATQGRGTLAERDVLASCGVFFDSITGSLLSRFGGADAPGKLTAMMNVFFKLNGLSIWTDAWRKSACLMMSHDLATQRGLAWTALSKARRRSLELCGFDEGQWEMLRKQKMKAADGRDYFTPDAAYEVDVKDIQAYFKSLGRKYNKELLAEYKEDMATRLRAFFKDRVQYAVLEPDARTGSLLHQGLSAGTASGQLLRLATQFKSFPTVFLERTMAREVYGRGADTLAQGLKQAVIPRDGETTGLIGMIAATTLFGYLSMATKQLIAGKNPRNPFESFEDAGKVAIASLVQGGGMGIIGDFLFSEKSRMGDSFLSTLAGPTMGTASELVRLYQSIRDGEDVSASAFRTVWSQLPGNNLYWLKPALDNMLLNSVYEWLNPGYLKRFRRRVEKENNQTFIFEPHVWDWAGK